MSKQQQIRSPELERAIDLFESAAQFAKVTNLSENTISMLRRNHRNLRYQTSELMAAACNEHLKANKNKKFRLIKGDVLFAELGAKT